MHHNKQQDSDRPTPSEAGGGEGFSRRDFLKGGVLAGVAGGAGLGAVYFGYETSLNKPVRLGLIGTGDEGSVGGGHGSSLGRLRMREGMLAADGADDSGHLFEYN